MKRTLQILIAGLALTSTSQALPVVLYHHAGSTDPTTEGWTALISSGTSVGPINDSGTPAWSIANTAAEEFGFYSVVPTATEVAAASLGWSLRVTLRITAPGDSPGGSMLALYRDGSRSYQMHFGSDAS